MSLTAITTRALARIPRLRPAARIGVSPAIVPAVIRPATADTSRSLDDRNPGEHRRTDMFAALQRAHGGMF
ncbi:hypothetical protein CLV46_2550 [Diaminobutyricimonas aerilata]|uniref:Uncharacterized protein n=1 Tax=Diaminobutyricimonas aerilata TaxID=1162967 RepID=A0A2M9CM49_9MICO|nr:hypothetical protein [Diaminobutyricimonas aerilata]PJJ72970.1 hypothetical protein CLV46_2550 [Diaminobutyricimonas aerilata]